MTDKDFDKRFKEKLDSLEPVQPSGAWESFKKLLPVPWYVMAFKQYGGWFFGGISTALLLFNTFKTENEKQVLTQIREVIKIDTVYSLKHSIDTVYQKIQLTKFIDRPVFVENVALNKAEENPIFELEKKDTVEIAFQKQEDTIPEENTYREAKKVRKDSSIVSNLAKMEDDKKSSFLSKIVINPGVEMVYMGGSNFAYGIIGEVMLKNRFSITTGLSINNSSPETFTKPQEFNKITGKVFTEGLQDSPIFGHQGSVSLPFSESVKDISIQTSRVRLPLYMSYYVPLSYKLDFLISTGTRLDLKVSESVSYRNENYGDASYRKIENQYKPAVFNNLFYGMGVQYRYGKLNGMLVPYFEFPFGKPNYVIRDNKFGINAALKFSLK